MKHKFCPAGAPILFENRCIILMQWFSKSIGAPAGICWVGAGLKLAWGLRDFRWELLRNSR